MVQNYIRFVFTAPLSPDGEIAEHVHKHGDGVHDIAFAVDDVESAWRELDPLIEDSIIGLLSRIQAERGLAMLFITHNLQLARCFADDAVVMRNGRIVEHGPVRTIFDRPRDPYTRALLAAIPTTEPGWLDRQLA